MHSNDEIYDLQSVLLYSRAFWVSRSIIAWNVDVEDGACYLYASRDAKLSVTDDEILGVQSVDTASSILWNVL